MDGFDVISILMIVFLLAYAVKTSIKISQYEDTNSKIMKENIELLEDCTKFERLLNHERHIKEKMLNDISAYELKLSNLDARIRYTDQLKDDLEDRRKKATKYFNKVEKELKEQLIVKADKIKELTSEIEQTLKSKNNITDEISELSKLLVVKNSEVNDLRIQLDEKNHRILQIEDILNKKNNQINELNDQLRFYASQSKKTNFDKSEYYKKILGIRSHMNKVDVKKNFLVLTKKMHPDNFDRDDEYTYELMTWKYKEILEAYNSLRS